MEPVTILSVVASFWPVLKDLTETGQSLIGRHSVNPKIVKIFKPINLSWH
jgi:hypothetical protein